MLGMGALKARGYGLPQGCLCALGLLLFKQRVC
jgi:hypothetical protein